MKKTRPLPTRGGLNDLGRSQRTIIDYAKAAQTRTPTFIDLAKKSVK